MIQVIAPNPKAPESKYSRFEGTITQIGNIIDPNQHTALVMGRVSNPDRLMRAGQYVAANVTLDANKDEVEIPTAALIENGAESTVLVQPEAGRFEFVLKRVAVVRRTEDYVSLRTILTDEEKKARIGPDGSSIPGLQALEPGQRVLTVGVLELTAAFKEQKDALRHKKK
jgi:cobalt-zinc-cadmium efflux system membrane fusion protein